MNKIEYLQKQAAKAEWLARNVADSLTVERLQWFATKCRIQVTMLSKKMEVALRPDRAWLRPQPCFRQFHLRTLRNISVRVSDIDHRGRDVSAHGGDITACGTFR